jgi:hypothetical protein
MLGKKDPWDIPEWHAIGREAALVRSLIGSGVTAQGRANYANQSGEYYTAFFGLSIGLERLAKLILVVDHAISNGGQMPHQQVVKKFGHKLVDLTNIVDTLLRKHQLSLEFSRPTDAVSAKIVECLDAFADAGRGRYANFASLGDPNLSQEEPIRKWWGEVAELILRKHYYGKQVQARVEARAQDIDAMISPFSLVRYISETGDPMQDVLSSSIRTGQTAIVQKFGRYYTLTLARWLAEVFSDLSRTACYNHNIDAFFGVWEYFQSYTVEDSFLKTRKVWPLT